MSSDIEGFYVIPNADNPDQGSLWDAVIHPTREAAQASLDQASVDGFLDPENYHVVALARIDELRHKVRFTADDFTVEHPLIERLDGSLMDCGIHAMCVAQSGPPSPLGTYWVSQHPADGSPVIELIEELES